MQTKVITLKHGITIKGETHTEVEIRPASLGDMMDAEAEATPDKPVSYRVALLAATVERIGSYKGPVTSKMLRAAHPQDWLLISTGMWELEQGEAEASDAGATS